LSFSRANAFAEGESLRKKDTPQTGAKVKKSVNHGQKLSPQASPKDLILSNQKVLRCAVANSTFSETSAAACLGDL